VLIESGQSVEEARAAIGAGWVGVVVRDLAEARQAIAAGADWLVAPAAERDDPDGDRPEALPGLAELVALGAPVYAADPSIDRLPATRAAGAWGVALTEAIWRAPDPAGATERILRTWL
jgi:thiamine-phosphate pyrophosphorylase